MEYMENNSIVEQKESLQRAENLAKTCLQDLQAQSSLYCGKSCTTYKYCVDQEGHQPIYEATGRDTTTCSTASRSSSSSAKTGLRNPLSVTPPRRTILDYSPFAGICHVSQNSKLKLSLCLKVSLTYLSTFLHRKPTRCKSGALTFQTAMLFFLLLLSSLFHTSLQEQTKASSTSSKPSNFPWSVSTDFEVEELNSDISSTVKRFEFPELIGYTGRLFQYHIPSQAFPKLKVTHGYQVSMKFI